MSTPPWRTKPRTVHGVDRRTKTTVPISVGLIDLPAGGVQVALQVDDGDELILSFDASRQLINNVTEVVVERLRVTGETLGGEEP